MIMQLGAGAMPLQMQRLALTCLCQARTSVQVTTYPIAGLLNLHDHAGILALELVLRRSLRVSTSKSGELSMAKPTESN